MMQNDSSPGGAAEIPRKSILTAAPPGLDLFGGVSPQLKLRAIFGCPCGTKPGCRKPLVKKLERFVKSKPQTPLRDIIRLTAEVKFALYKPSFSSKLFRHDWQITIPVLINLRLPLIQIR